MGLIRSGLNIYTAGIVNDKSKKQRVAGRTLASTQAQERMVAESLALSNARLLAQEQAIDDRRRQALLEERARQAPQGRCPRCGGSAQIGAGGSPDTEGHIPGCSLYVRPENVEPPKYTWCGNPNEHGLHMFQPGPAVWEPDWSPTKEAPLMCMGIASDRPTGPPAAAAVDPTASPEVASGRLYR